MKLTKIKIENFKSIKEIEFDVKKHGSSYATMLLGLNESGKSNVLEAMSFLNTPAGEFIYYDYHNQKDTDYEPVDLWFSIAFEDENTYLKEIKKELNGGDLLNFKIIDIVKNVYIQHEETNFSESYDFDIKDLTKGLFIKKGIKNITNSSGQEVATDTFDISKTNEDGSFELLDDAKFKELFSEKIKKIIKKYPINVTFWKPSEEYLISTEDLNKFAENINSKPALKNIFLLANYKTSEDIKNIVKTISNGQQRSRLQSVLQDKLDKYVKDIWDHDIDIVVDITETGKFTLSIKDQGQENQHDRLAITGRSEGARHFLSLILSLSIESEEQRKNQLILIDEPEAHLHPSGIRDLRKELLRIGHNNYLFVSTHSPFLVDRKNKERNIIIKKNPSALTEKIHIESHSNIIDDEVLREAFGLEVYKDLLNPHRILVEGFSDKQILQKILLIKGKDNFGITNGHGSNIDTLASKLNDVDISILVVVDDDKDGKIYQSKIIKIGNFYSSENVLTIRDLVGSLVNGSTIEDMLGKNYVESMFKESYKEEYKGECDITLEENKPFVNQMKTYLNKNNKEEDMERFIEVVKNKLANDLKLSKSSLEANFRRVLDT